MSGLWKNNDMMDPLMAEPVVGDMGRGEQPRMLPRAKSGRQQRAESIWIRRAGIFFELGWLLSALTIQLYVPGNKGYWIVCAMLVAYIFYYSERLDRVSRRVLLFSLAVALGALGGMGFGGTGYGAVKDVYQPLHMGLELLAVMGIFVGKYHRRSDITILAGALVVLLIVGIMQSIKRNNLLETWADGGRTGVNLQAMFIMVALAYGFLLKGRWKFVVLPLYLALFWLGSRTAFVTALAFPVIYAALHKETRKNLPHLIMTLGGVVTVLFCIVTFLDVGQIMRDAGLPVAYQRMFDETVKEGTQGRQELSLFWLDYLLNQPTWFGNGIDTYGSRFDMNWPHNGYLHVFNGFGVICGLVYFWLVIKTCLGYIRHSAAFPDHIVWAGAFLLTMLLRKFGEAQLLVEPTHVAGFAVTYATGLAIWAVEHYQGNNRPKRQLHRSPRRRNYDPDPAPPVGSDGPGRPTQEGNGRPARCFRIR